MGKTTAELEAQTGRFRAVGFEDPEHKQDDRGYFYAVVDTRDGSHIGWDGGEPEDQGLTRDWYWVVEALNQVDSEKDKLMAGLVGLRDDCLATYLGGYREENEIEIFRHGMETVCNVIDAMTKRTT